MVHGGGGKGVQKLETFFCSFAQLQQHSNSTQKGLKWLVHGSWKGRGSPKIKKNFDLCSQKITIERNRKEGPNEWFMGKTGLKN